jgi:hypothetical protein
MAMMPVKTTAWRNEVISGAIIAQKGSILITFYTLVLVHLE